jgi:hypothetical protein
MPEVASLRATPSRPSASLGSRFLAEPRGSVSFAYFDSATTAQPLGSNIASSAPLFRYPITRHVRARTATAFVQAMKQSKRFKRDKLLGHRQRKD